MAADDGKLARTNEHLCFGRVVSRAAHLQGLGPMPQGDALLRRHVQFPLQRGDLLRSPLCLLLRALKPQLHLQKLVLQSVGSLRFVLETTL